jgi:deoxyribose-phosphate aldolase
MTRTDRRLLELLVRCMDLTSLEQTDTEEKITALCGRAIRPDPSDPSVPAVAAVCVYPRLVPVARRTLEGTGIRVACATGAFPSGVATTHQRVAEIREALAFGADEIDTVLDHGAALAGHDDEVREQLDASREACGNAPMKVILETGALDSKEAIARAARLAMDAGADFIKSSTGKIAVGATLEAAAVMIEGVRAHETATGHRVGVKFAGGIRTGEAALEYLGIVGGVLGKGWLSPRLFRIGASSLLDDLVDRLRAGDR